MKLELLVGLVADCNDVAVELVVLVVLVIDCADGGRSEAVDIG